MDHAQVEGDAATFIAGEILRRRESIALKTRMGNMKFTSGGQTEVKRVDNDGGTMEERIRQLVVYTTETPFALMYITSIIEGRAVMSIIASKVYREAFGMSEYAGEPSKLSILSAHQIISVENCDSSLESAYKHMIYYLETIRQSPRPLSKILARWPFPIAREFLSILIKNAREHITRYRDQLNIMQPYEDTVDDLRREYKLVFRMVLDACVAHKMNATEVMNAWNIKLPDGYTGKKYPTIIENVGFPPEIFARLSLPVTVYLTRAQKYFGADLSSIVKLCAVSNVLCDINELALLHDEKLSANTSPHELITVAQANLFIRSVVTYYKTHLSKIGAFG